MDSIHYRVRSSAENADELIIIVLIEIQEKTGVYSQVHIGSVQGIVVMVKKDLMDVITPK